MAKKFFYLNGLNENLNARLNYCLAYYEVDPRKRSEHNNIQ